MIWIVVAFFIGAYLGAIIYGVIVAWRDLHPGRRRRPPPPLPWDFGPRTETRY